jgi:hypothetical protein
MVFLDSLVADEDSKGKMYDRGGIVGVGGNRRNTGLRTDDFRPKRAQAVVLRRVAKKRRREQRNAASEIRQCGSTQRQFHEMPLGTPKDTVANPARLLD